MILDRILPPGDREAIERAVRACEERTGCEVVVTVVPACDSYHHAAWKGAALGALAGALGAGLASRGLEVWGYVWSWLLLPAPTGAALGWLLAQVPPLRQILVTPEVIERRVAGRAAEAFLTAQVAGTRERSGVLIFLAIFERRVVVRADRAVEARVPATAWSEVTRAVGEAMRHGSAGNALLRALSRCEAILLGHGFVRPAGTAGAANEISDAVRVEE